MMAVGEGDHSPVFRLQMESLMLSGRKLTYNLSHLRRAAFWIPLIYAERWRIAQALPKSSLLRFKSPEEPPRCKLKAGHFLTVSMTGNPHAWRSSSGVWRPLGKVFERLSFSFRIWREQTDNLYKFKGRMKTLIQVKCVRLFSYAGSRDHIML